MKGLPEERAVMLGTYILENNATVRKTAKEFHISKSTVHKDVAQRLKMLNPQLYNSVKAGTGSKQIRAPYSRRYGHQAKIREFKTQIAPISGPKRRIFFCLVHRLL